MKLEPTKHMLQCPQCGHLRARVKFQNGVCGWCADRLRHQQNTQQRAFSQHSQPQPQYSQPSQVGNSGDAASGGCLVVVAFFFLPYITFNWMFWGGRFSLMTFVECLESIWAWGFSIVFWLVVIGLFNSRR